MSPQLELGFWKRRRVRLVRQNEVAECGLASVAMVAAFHGFDVDLGLLRRRFELSSRGATLKSLILIADSLNLTPRAVKIPLEDIGALHLPAVLHWDMNHFVVLERVSRDKALIHNPAGSSRWMTLAQISPHFTGIALELRPSENFEPEQRRERLKLSQLWRRITGLKRALIQTLVLSMVLEAFVLALPYYMQLALDAALPAQDTSLLTVLAIGFGLFTLINAGASMLRSFVLLSAGTAFGYGVTTNIARRLLRLPIAWFEKRQIGDVLSRFQSVLPIQQFLTQGAISTLIDGGLAIFTLALMFFYSPLLAAIALTAFVTYAGIRLASFNPQRLAQEEAIITAGREQSKMIESLRGVITLRMFNRETARHAQWQSLLVESVNAQVSYARIGIWQTVGNTLTFGLENVISIWLAIRFVIDGGFSVGMVFAYMAYKTQFLTRAGSLIDQSVAFRMLGLHLERLSDIALTEQDKSLINDEVCSTPLDGNIKLRDVSYRYSVADPVILDRINMDINAGEHVAITGPSGGGKSTLIKIILGLIEPDEGEILIDGKPLPRFGFKNYRDQVSAVLQDDNLFAGSLSENIALFDDAPDLDRVIEAAKAVALHDDIVLMPMGYDTLVGDMGSALSGGQKQRVLLARALYRRPRLLVIDEGTSHLDAARENLVNIAVAELGITRIVVAHRLETIAAAPRVLKVQNGRLSDVTSNYATIREQFGHHNESADNGGAPPITADPCVTAAPE